ncbi:hypothetical protein D3C80_2146860 [compost metagenome]
MIDGAVGVVDEMDKDTWFGGVLMAWAWEDRIADVGVGVVGDVEETRMMEHSDNSGSLGHGDAFGDA